jgi:anaerobic selenocysteine-containing dehydrogenase
LPGMPTVGPSSVGSVSIPRKTTRDGVETRKALCASCDIACSVVTEIQKGRVTRVRSSDNPLFRDNICVKGIVAPKNYANPARVLFPQKRVGPRGSGQWERVSWDDAMTDIAQRLRAIMNEHGPEAWAVSTSQWNTCTDHGLGRRLMNHLGAPNWISGVALCAGNTAAVNRMTYGWFPWPDYDNTKCVVLFGHNPGKNSWVPVYNQIQRIKARGGKLIVLDPRKSECAELADLWLPLKAGSDAAMMLGWLKVILDEELYDAAFVRRWTVGFEELRERVQQFPLARVEELTGVSRDLITRAARIYACDGPSVIPWTPITDQQRNSTSAIRLQCILRAICGFLDVPGGEALMGFHSKIVSESEIEMHHLLSDVQKDKQLGSDKHPVYTYRGQAPLREPCQRVWGHEYANQLTGCFMANPSSVFRAMAGEGPYPVKALFSLGNNTLMGYANMPLILRAMLNQELIVVQDHVMTPTAQLADYVLPGDSWLERPGMFDGFGWVSVCKPSQKSMEPPGECKSTFEFWKLMANALDLPHVVPWPTLEAFYDWRLAPLGLDFETFSRDYEVHGEPIQFRKYEQTGFATPSGKVELQSSILADLGFDSLPYWRGEPPRDPDYPLPLFVGVREPEYYQSAGRHVPELRARRPEPVMFVSPRTALEQGIAEGDWVRVETRTGGVEIQVGIRTNMPDDLVRVPHGWWKPETEQGLGKLSGAMRYADAQLCPDDDAYLDLEQGVPHLKGIACRIVREGAGEP